MKILPDIYFMMLARAASLRSTCPRLSVGSVLVKEGRVISTGYNGAPSGFKECLQGGCVMYQGPGEERPRCINTVHAEINALTRARETGDTFYTTDTPCINCLKALLAHNPKIEIVYLREYSDDAQAEFHRNHKDKIKIRRLSSQSVEELYSIMPKGIAG